ncbi:efflux transporter outer membrane subunit [Sphingomonas morindae]|uniref:Efflux transporter outer membrane subunit n=1 Tax=Sphingomonas morindae TaxID=1541170 RepID=A0ABY4XBA2_9SPHN|nr:efflux transporter outer membrane subunit [Sphingomonas morindae]USI74031.1 efflux transporter outer membrane subunit [Sphingomonas morindae]
MRRLVLLALLAAAGCTAGPDYHLPERALVNAPAAQGAFANAAEPAFVPADLPDHWWRLYADPRLDGFIGEALSANTDLRAAEANLRRAGAVIREAEAARTVGTSLSGGATFTHTAAGSRLGDDIAYSLGGALSYPLDLAGGIRRGIEAARADAEASQAARDQVRVAVAAAVARNYAAACSANRTLAAAERVLGVQRDTLNAITRLFRGGRNTAFDVTRAQAAVDQSAAQIPAILASRQASLYALAALMGRPAAAYPRVVEACATPPILHRPLPIGDGAALLRRRPDIRQAERSLAAATAAIGVESAQLYPQISLGGSLAVAGPVSTIGSAASLTGSLGPLVSWSFPNRIGVRARIAEAGAAADAAAAQFDGTVLTALQDVETALNAYAREIDRNRALSRARDDAATAAAQANRLFRFGRTDFLNVLSAQSNLATAESALAASDATLVDRQIAVFLSLGGGWQPD